MWMNSIADFSVQVCLWTHRTEIKIISTINTSKDLRKFQRLQKDHLNLHNLNSSLFIRELLICKFAYPHWQNWFKMPIFESKMFSFSQKYTFKSKIDFLSENSIFAVRNDRSYLKRITRETCKSYFTNINSGIIS